MNPILEPRPAISPIPASLWAGALSQLLSYDETGCPHAARRAADMLDRLAASPAVDGELRNLCERAAQRLDLNGNGGGHVRHL
ncbi:hypothetical protein [Zoogloea sp.]|uniref:hypothetical protein n=1 Tax=Zoogloea sp. TaxID=49181 RepID=UPI002637EB01|nr:hypothetical protein [Zoogloea sp.]MDD3354177.1 hypothetical protein [Zoogloea sp.]